MSEIPATSTQTSLTSRAWLAVALTAPLLALLFFPSILLVDVYSDAGDGWAELAYVLWGIWAYTAGVLVVLPIVAHTVGRFVDARTRDISAPRAGVAFGMLAGALGTVAAVPMTIEGNVGWAPVVTYVAAPALAAFLTRVLIPLAEAHKAVRVTTYVIAVLVVAPIAGLAFTLGLSTIT